MTTTQPAAEAHTLSDPSHLAEGFHTAFRKGMDSPYGVLVHGIIGLLPNKVWTVYTRHLAAAIEDAGRVDAAVLRDACLDFDPHTRFKTTEYRDHADVLKAAFAVLPPRAWAEIASFLNFDPSDWKKGNPKEPESGIDAGWLSLIDADKRAKMHVFIAPQGDPETAWGEIRVVEVMVPAEGDKPRRRVIAGYEPILYGHPPVPMPTRNGFETIEAAWDACLDRLREANRAKARLFRSGLRAHDEAWAEANLPRMAAVCRYIEGRLPARDLEGFKVRRALHGVAFATKAYNEARGKPVPDKVQETSYDLLVEALRLESYLREFAHGSRPDSRLGFAARYAVHGKDSALRSYKGAAYRECFIDASNGDPNRPEELLQVLEAEPVA